MSRDDLPSGSLIKTSFPLITNFKYRFPKGCFNYYPSGGWGESGDGDIGSGLTNRWTAGRTSRRGRCSVEGCVGSSRTAFVPTPNITKLEKSIFNGKT